MQRQQLQAKKDANTKRKQNSSLGAFEGIHAEEQVNDDTNYHSQLDEAYGDKQRKNDGSSRMSLVQQHPISDGHQDGGGKSNKAQKPKASVNVNFAGPSKPSGQSNQIIRTDVSKKARQQFQSHRKSTVNIEFKSEIIEQSAVLKRNRTLRQQFQRQSDDEEQEISQESIAINNGGTQAYKSRQGSVAKKEQKEANERMKKYLDNKATKLHLELEDADAYMNKVTKTINLSELYEIADYYYTGEAQKICPVLLKIKHWSILEQENPNMDIEELKAQQSASTAPQGRGSHQKGGNYYLYLLQIWRKRDATMLYERKLKQVPVGWGMQNQDEGFDMFFYQEAENEDECESNPSRIYCFAYREAKELTQQDEIRLHAFSLPESITKAQQREAKQKQLRVQGGNNVFKMDELDVTRAEEAAAINDQASNLNEKSKKSPEVRRNTGKVRPESSQNKKAYDKVNDEQNEIIYGPSQVEKYNQKIKDAAPNIKRNICCINGKLVMATSKSLIELDLRNLMDDEADNWKTYIFSNYQQEVKHFREQHCVWIDIQHDYQFVNFMDTGTGGTAMILENKESKQIRFVLLLYNREFNCNLEHNEEPKLSFQQLGLAQRAPKKKAEIVKTCTAQSCVKIGTGNDESERKNFTITIVLRSNGQIEIYSDYELTQQGKCSDPKLFCVDVVADTESFFLKYLDLTVDENKVGKVVYEVRQVSHQWRNRIQYSYSKQVDLGRDWDSCKLKTLSQYMKLYPQWLVYSNFFLVAHRGYISVQDLNTEDYDDSGEFQKQEKRSKKNKRFSLFCCTEPEATDESTDPILLNNFMENNKRVNVVRESNMIKTEVEDKWIQHIKVDKTATLDHIRQMFLEKRFQRSELHEPIPDLLYHAQPNYPLHKQFIVTVVLGLNKVISFRLKKIGRLAPCKLAHIREAPGGCITDIQIDNTSRTGTLLTVCLTDQNSSQRFDNNTYEDRKFEDQGTDQEGHYIFIDAIQRAKLQSQSYQILHINYKQINIIFDSRYSQGHNEIQSSDQSQFQGGDNRDLMSSYGAGQPLNVKNEQRMSLPIIGKHESYQSSTDTQQQLIQPSTIENKQISMLSMDCQLQVVKTSKSIWNKELEIISAFDDKSLECDSFFKKLLKDDDNKNKEITALVVYKKGEHLTLVPFIKQPSLNKAKVSAPDRQVKPNREQAIKRKTDEQYDETVIHPSFPNQQDNPLGNYGILQNISIKLLDQEKCDQILKDEDLQLLTFVGYRQVKQDIDKDCFIIVTKNVIHVFNEKREEQARISGLQITSATMIDQQYLYIQEEFCYQVFEQFADEENENQLCEPIVNENFEQESGFTAINFTALFNGNFKEIWVCHAATGQNSEINRSWTTEDISIMKSPQEVAIIPIPHWNSMSFVGMGSKNQYLIWKDSIDGFFTALRNNGELITWSSVSGKLLWEEQQYGDLSREMLKDYQVYRSDKNDITYLSDYYNYNDARNPENSYSISLLASQLPVKKEFIDQEIAICELRDGPQYQCCHEHHRIKQEIQRQSDSDLNFYDKEFFFKKREQNSEMIDLFKVRGADSNSNAAETREFKEKLIRNKLYHFKVIQLRQFEDILRTQQLQKNSQDLDQKEGGQPQQQQISSECKVLFHFFHKLLHPFKVNSHGQRYFENSDWFLNNSNIKQRLYLSAKAEKMLEVIQNRMAIVWQQNSLPDQQLETEGNLVQWHSEPHHILPNFPFYALEVSSLPYFISDDFETMCEFNTKEQRMSLVSTKRNSMDQEFELIDQLPQEALHFQSNSNFEKDMIKQAFASVAIRGSHEVVTFNSAQGLLTRWPLRIEQDDEGTSKLKFKKEEGETHLYSISSKIEWNGLHYFEDPDNQKRQRSIERRIFDATEKFRYEMKQRCARRQNKDLQTEEDSEYTYSPQALEELQNINYSFKWTNSKSRFTIDRPFTWIDWKRAELIVKDKDENFEDLQQEEKLRLMFSVFPQGNNLLRMLALSIRQDGIGQKQDSSNEAEALFQSAIDGFQVKNGNTWMTIYPQVPLITDCYGLQPLDYAFGMCSHVQDKQKYKERFLSMGQEEKNDFEKLENLKLVQVIFHHTKEYKSFQNTLNMVEPIIKAVELQLPQVFDYLNARILMTSHIPNALNTSIKPERLQNSPTMGEYGLIQTDDLTQTTTAQKKLFQKPDDTKKKKLYDYFWFDVPLIFAQTESGYSFMEALQQTRNVELYSHKGIQLIVANQWHKWRRTNQMLILMPMAIQIFVFSILSCVLTPQKDNVPTELIHALEIISAILAVYFLMIEIIAMRGGAPIDDLLHGEVDIILNLLSPFMILVTQILSFLPDDSFENAQEAYWETLAWTTFFLWFRFLLMLRSVPLLSPAVSMVLRCFSEIAPYLIVVAIGVLAFGDAFQSINQIAYRKASQMIATSDENYIEPPIYKNMEVEDFDTFTDKYFGEYISVLKQQFIGSVIGFEGEGTGLWTGQQWLLYITCIFFNAIVLMNILLALVGEVFGEVHGKSQEYTYLQLVNQICLLQRIKNEPIRNNSLKVLFIANQRRDLSEDSNNDSKQKKVDAQTRKIDRMTEQLEEISQELRDLDIKTSRMLQTNKKQRSQNRQQNATTYALASSRQRGLGSSQLHGQSKLNSAKNLATINESEESRQFKSKGYSSMNQALASQQLPNIYVNRGLTLKRMTPKQ